MPSSNSKETETRVLPEDFVPGDNHVIIGRGKKCLEHEGNIRLRKIVKRELSDYVEATCKVDKSLILLRIIRDIRHKNDDMIGFVKQDLHTGKWLELSEFSARVAVAQAFRDALSTRYKSSKQSKQYKRRVQRMSMPPSNDCNLEARRMEMPSLPMMNSDYSQEDKYGSGYMMGMQGMSHQMSLSNAYRARFQEEQRMKNQMMQFGQMMQQQQQQYQHLCNMMMMNQGPMMQSNYMTGMPMMGYSDMHTPSRPSSFYSAPVGNGASLSDILDPLPVEDEDDFVDVFHSLPLPNLKKALKSIKG